MYVYIIKCSDDTLYTGVTSNLKRRITQHNKGIGSKYTFPRRPVKCMYSEKRKDRSAAMRREAEIKKWPKDKKLALIKR